MVESCRNDGKSIATEKALSATLGSSSPLVIVGRLPVKKHQISENLPPLPSCKPNRGCLNRMVQRKVALEAANDVSITL